MSDRHQSKTLFVEELLYSNTIAQTLGNLLYSGEHQGDVLFDLCCQIKKIKQLVLEVLFLCITFLVCLSFSIFFFFIIIITTVVACWTLQIIWSCKEIRLELFMNLRRNLIICWISRMKKNCIPPEI